MTRVVLVPGVLALLPAYAGIEDPVADLRAACREAVTWLGPDVTVIADVQGATVGSALVEASTTLAGARAAKEERPPDGPAYLVVGNGSAKRTDKAPGAFDERAEAFDAGLGASLRAGWPELDSQLADELWASIEGIARLGGLGDLGPAQVDYDDAPYGVQYWVMRWTCKSSAS